MKNTTLQEIILGKESKDYLVNLCCSDVLLPAYLIAGASGREIASRL